MPRTVVWTEKARADYFAQLRYIAGDSPQNARLVKARLNKAIRGLAEVPVGRPGRVSKTYEKYVFKTSHIVCYELSQTSNTLVILRILHTSRNWNQGEWPDE